MIGKALISLCFCTVFAFGSAVAQCVSLTAPGTATTQNFDGLSNTAGSTTNNLTVTGWFLTETGGGSRDNEQYAVDTGTAATGDTYSYGTSASPDRALGGLRSSTLVPIFGACFTNNTGSTIGSLAIAYTGEQWRLGTASRTDQIDFEYATDATSLTTGTWTTVAGLTLVTPNTTTTGAKDGNAPANRSALSSVIDGLSVANGATLWIRWTDLDAFSADDGLAVDDFSLTPMVSAVQFSSATYSNSDDIAAIEANGRGPMAPAFTTVTVNRSGAVENAVSVQFATADGTATGGAACAAGIDYVSTGGTLNFGAGVLSETFNVTVCPDTVFEGDETIDLTLSNPGGGAALGTPNAAVLTLIDDDRETTPPTVSYTPLANIPAVSDRIFTVAATDNVGVTGVTVVWENNGNAGSLSNACAFDSGSPQNGTWICTIQAGSGLPPQTSPGSVTYFVSAVDAAGNLSSNPAGAGPGSGPRNLFTVGSGGTIDVSAYQTFENVTLGGGFTLNGNASVSGVLILNGLLNTGTGNSLTLGCGASVSGAGGNNYVVGNVAKQYCATGSFIFPVGTAPDNAFADIDEGVPAAAEYSPFTANVTAIATVPSTLAVTVTDARFPNGMSPAQSASRYWSVTESGELTADISFTWLADDVSGTESAFDILRRGPDGITAVYAGGNVDDATHTGTAPGVSDFSQWGAGQLAPTAANASIEGRVVSGEGLGIRNATVMVAGGGLAEPRYVQTGQLGFFRFDDLPVGETYVVSVISRRFTFTIPSRAVTLDDNVTGFDFEAQP
jgi:hypothetical protein